METVLVAIVALGSFLGLAIAFLYTRDKVSKFIWHTKNPPEKLEKERKEYEEKIKQPDWNFYERHLERSVPTQLKELYQNENLITSGGFNYNESFDVSTFEPINAQALAEAKKVFEKNILPILSTGFGDAVYLKPGKNEENKIYITYLDGGDTEIFENSIDDFVRKLKSQQNTAAKDFQRGKP